MIVLNELFLMSSLMQRFTQGMPLDPFFFIVPPNPHNCFISGLLIQGHEYTLPHY